jgi:hypothetical protein
MRWFLPLRKLLQVHGILLILLVGALLHVPRHIEVRLIQPNREVLLCVCGLSTRRLLYDPLGRDFNSSRLLSWTIYFIFFECASLRIVGLGGYYIRSLIVILLQNWIHTNTTRTIIVVSTISIGFHYIYERNWLELCMYTPMAVFGWIASTTFKSSEFTWTWTSCKS